MITMVFLVGALQSADAVNYAARSAIAGKGSAVVNCTDGATLLVGAALPTGYVITSLAIAAGNTTTCTLTDNTVSPAVTATFKLTGIL